MADAVDREDELRQAFAADIAHELRTPLAILQGQLEAIQDGITRPDLQLIDSLHEESLRMGRLVADPKALVDAGAAGFTLQRQEIALHPLVATALDGLAGHVAELEIEVIRHLDDVTVFADPVRLTQVITNMLTNATYTPPGGTITSPGAVPRLSRWPSPTPVPVSPTTRWRGCSTAASAARRPDRRLGHRPGRGRRTRRCSRRQHHRGQPPRMRKPVPGPAAGDHPGHARCLHRIFMTPT